MTEKKTENTVALPETMAPRIMDWYAEKGRSLPWRRTSDPYAIWISEIMLQQTQVDTVIPYYERFLRTLPDIPSLAAADEETVLKLWEGLGYYRRAMHLREAAGQMMSTWGGRMPEHYEDLLHIKGIGSYTAAAISSIAFGEARGVVDGNILRILSRLLNLPDNIALDATHKKYQQIMDAAIANADPSAFNQGMMDLGAVICTPVRPACGECPLTAICLGRAAGRERLLPVNLKKVKKSEAAFITAIIRRGEDYLILRNPPGLLGGLYGLVQYEAPDPEAFEDLFAAEYGCRVRLTEYLKDFKHVFTHRTWQMHVYTGDLVTVSPKAEAMLVSEEQLDALPVSTAHLKVLRAYRKSQPSPGTAETARK